MPKVFVIQKTFKEMDYSSAANYGAIHFLLEPDQSPSTKPAVCRAKIYKELYANFDYKTDYIVWSGGDSLALFMAAAVLAKNLNVPAIKWLKFERGRDLEGNRVPGKSFYTPVEVKI